MLHELDNTWQWSKKLAKAETSDEIQDIVGSFAGWAVELFAWVTEHEGGDTIKTTLKRLDKLARTLVMKSKGIIQDFRLSEEWFRMVVAQLAVDGAEDDGRDVDDFIDNYLSVLWGTYGWDVSNSINPVANNTTTTMNLGYKRDTETATIKVLLVPVSKTPIGAFYESSKGKHWELLGIEDGTVHMVEIDFNWNPQEHTSKTFKEIKIPFSLFAEMKRVYVELSLKD